MNWKWMRVAFLVVFLIILAVVLYLLLHRDDTPCFPDKRETTCYQSDQMPYRLYGTKTDYRVLVDQNHLEKNREFTMPGCTAQALFLYNRHTTRYPDKDDIIRMQAELPRLSRAIQESARRQQVHICSEDIQHLDNWTVPFIPENDNHMTPTGAQVVGDQVRRLKTRFPALFSKPFDVSDFIVGFTSRVRTRETAEAFLKHLLPKSEYDEVVGNFGAPQDSLLQFHKECGKLIKDKEDNPAEVDKLENGPYMQRVLDRMSWRLGFNVTREDAKVMARICAFEYAIRDHSPWCAVFGEDELKVLEFRDDLDDYYEDGYGRDRNYIQACPILKELVYRFRNASRDPRQPTKLLYFSHAGGFKKVVARLGLHRDNEALTADGLCSQASRQWRSSVICPFNANLVFVLFKCPGRDHHVAAFLNEQLQQLPGCPSQHCPLATFLSLYGDIAESCNLRDICSA